MNKCVVCQKPTKRPKYCSDKCQKKAWKIEHREKYLEGKKAYRKSAKEKVNAYNRQRRKELRKAELKKKLATLEKAINRIKD